MDQEKIKHLCVRAADRAIEALQNGDNRKALELIPELTREDRNMHKLLAQCISQFIIPYIQKHFIDDQKEMGAQIEQAIKAGEKDKAIALIEAKTEKWRTIHDLYIDFMGDTFGWVYDNFGWEGLRALYAMWGEGTKDWFIRRTQVSRDELIESGSTMWREHLADTQIKEGKTSSWFIQQPCGSGGRRLKRIQEGRAGKSGVSLEMKDEFPLEVGGRKDIPVYCTHCPSLFELMGKKWTGQPVWKVNPPSQVGDPCIIEVFDRPQK